MSAVASVTSITSAVSAKLRRSWESAQKTARKEGESRLLVEIWHVRAPLHAGLREPKIVQRYPLEVTDEGESLVDEWLDTVRMTAEAYGGENLFEVTFAVRDEHQGAVKVPVVVPGLTPAPAPAPAAAAFAAGAYHHPSAADSVVHSLAAQMSQAMSMVMRHYEKSQELMNRSQEQLQGSLMRQIDGQTRRIETLELERTALIVTHEETLTLKEERALMATRAEKDEKRKDELFSNGIMLGTALLKNWANGQIDASALRDTTNNVALKRFVESLTSSQFEGVMGQLTLQQQILITELISGAQDELERKPDSPKATP